MLFCPLCSGSSGNATFIEAGGARVLVDAGLTGKRITELLAGLGVAPDTLDAILVTHEHSDHVQGVGVLSRRYGIPVYANEACFGRMLPQTGALAPGKARVFEPDRPFFIRDVEVLPFSTPHDSARPVGYTFAHKGCRCAVMTDIGHVTQHMLDTVANADILLLEANHDVDMLRAGAYPYALKQRILSGTGHLCNEDAGYALVKLFGRGLRNVILGHLSAENNTPELALVTVQTVLDDAGVLPAMRVLVAERDRPTGLFEVGA